MSECVICDRPSTGILSRIPQTEVVEVAHRCKNGETEAVGTVNWNDHISWWLGKSCKGGPGISVCPHCGTKLPIHITTEFHDRKP